MKKDNARIWGKLDLQKSLCDYLHQAVAQKCNYAQTIDKILIYDLFGVKMWQDFLTA